MNLKRKKSIVSRVLTLIFSVFLLSNANTIITRAETTDEAIDIVYPNFNDEYMKGMLNLDSYSYTSAGIETVKDASKMLQSDGTLNLTQNVYAMTSDAIYKNPMALGENKSFSTYFSFKVGINNNNDYEGDGFTFVLSDKERELSRRSQGGNLGVYKSDSLNNLAIEFDIYNNQNEPNVINGISYSEQARHIGINLNGKSRSLTAINTYDYVDGNTQYAWIDYSGQVIEVRLSKTNHRPVNPTLSANLDLTQYLTGDKFYVGFTGSTGGYGSIQDIQSWYFNSEYSPIDINNKNYTIKLSPVDLSVTPFDTVATSTEVKAVVKNIAGALIKNKTVSFESTVGNLSSATAITDNNGVATVTLNSGLISGNSTVSASIDGAVNSSVEVYVPAYIPAPTITNPSSGTIDDIYKVNVDGSSVPGLEVNLFNNNALVGTVFANETGNWSIDNVALVNGSNDLYAVTKNTAQETSDNSKTVTINVKDTLAPEIILQDTVKESDTVIMRGVYTNPDSRDVIVTDNLGEEITPSIKIEYVLGNNPTQEVTTIDTNKVGTYTITYTATDSTGNSSSVKRNVNVIYSYGGILQPINSDGSSVYKAGSTIPVKFQLKDANGDYLTGVIAKLSYAKVTNNIAGDINEATSTSSATTGNLFRYDTTNNQYIFNLSTKGLSTGTYNLVIELDDGKSYDVQIGLR